MFLDAQKHFEIDMEASVMIGDKADEMHAAEGAGVKTEILVRTGKAITQEGEGLATLVLESIVDVLDYLKAHSFAFINVNSLNIPKVIEVARLWQAKPLN